MTPLLRPSARAVHLLCIAFSMLLLAYVVNSRLDAWLSQHTPVRYVSAVARPATPPAPRRLTPPLDVPVTDHDRRDRCPLRSQYVAQQRGPRVFEVSRRPGTQAVEVDPSCHLLDARLVPSFRDGKTHGFKLFSVRPESFIAQLGLHNGDTLRSVNGMALDSPERALELYLQLNNASLHELLIERDGKPLRHTYFTQK